MRTLITVFGFLALIASIILLIVVLIIKKPKKYAGIGILLGLVLFIFGLAMPSGSPTTPSSTNEPTSVATSPSEPSGNTSKSIANNSPKSGSDVTAVAPSNTDNATYLKPGPANIARHGGLGDSFDIISEIYGKPTRTIQAMSQGFGSFGFENDKVQVYFTQDRASQVTQNMDNAPLSMNDAEALAKSMMPSDAKFVNEYDKSDTEKIFVYQSQTLSKLYDDKWFSNKAGDIQSGYFDIDYLLDNNGKVVSVDSFIGDNP